jgi:hypothetical protein
MGNQTDVQMYWLGNVTEEKSTKGQMCQSSFFIWGENVLKGKWKSGNCTKEHLYLGANVPVGNLGANVPVAKSSWNFVNLPRIERKRPFRIINSSRKCYRTFIEA